MRIDKNAKTTCPVQTYLAWARPGVAWQKWKSGKPGKPCPSRRDHDRRCYGVWLFPFSTG